MLLARVLERRHDSPSDRCRNDENGGKFDSIGRQGYSGMNQISDKKITGTNWQFSMSYDYLASAETRVSARYLARADVVAQPQALVTGRSHNEYSRVARVLDYS